MVPPDQSEVMCDIARRLTGYLQGKLPDAGEIVVSGLERISGGASRETYRLRASYGGGHRALILRRDPPASLIETDRRVEFAALRTFHGGGVPAPEPLWLEEDTAVLGHPFFIMAEIEGCEASPAKLLLPPYSTHRQRTGQETWQILGRIARTDIAATPLGRLFPDARPESIWRDELDRWERVIDTDELEPQPIARAAIRWLRRNPPPSAQRLSAVHGDYRTGNLLVEPTGAVRGVLDWEMAHVGDPLEDLAWSLGRVWRLDRSDLAGSLLPRADAIAHWEQASGLVAEPEALRWWELFNCVKGQAIWLSAAREYQTGANRDAIMAIAAWMQTNSQDRAMLELMGHLA
jgi:aminoglycoside phosphotransferase (APT) family kinase protein